MKKTIFSLLLLPVIIAVAYAQSFLWKVDSTHSNVTFTITHMAINEVEGRFRVFDGSVTSDKPDFSDARIDFTVDISSLSTDNDMRDKHLKGTDFFNVEKYPKASFVSTGIKKLGDNKFKLNGNLTMMDVTKPVSFDLAYKGTVKDGYGNTKAGFKMNGVINRKDFGLKWSKITEGVAVVSDEVSLVANVQLLKKPASN